jgi:hypothetical protein
MTLKEVGKRTLFSLVKWAWFTNRLNALLKMFQLPQVNGIYVTHLSDLLRKASQFVGKLEECFVLCHEDVNRVPSGCQRFLTLEGLSENGQVHFAETVDLFTHTPWLFKW